MSDGTTVLAVAAEVLRVFQNLCSERMNKQDVPPNLIVVFAAIIATPGRSLTELQSATGLGQAVVSRSVTTLREGLGLVAAEVDPANLSRKLVSPTREGRDLAKQIAETLRLR